MRTTATFCVLLAIVFTANALTPVTLAEKDGIADSYIVTFEDTIPAALHSSDLAYFKTFHSVEYDHTYKATIKGFAATLNKDQLMAVRNHPRVVAIEQNQKVFTAQACPDGVSTTLWGLNRISIRGLNPNEESFFATKFSKLGTGVDVYVIDTGTNINHVDFGTRAVWGYTVPNQGWGNTDDQGHGTHVSSTAAGGSYGIARNARVIAVRVLGPDGSGSTAGVISGVEYAVTNKAATGKPSVGNMSLGGGASAAMDNAVNAASRAGVIMVVAAGNNNNNACNGSPARAAEVISVGATAQTSDGLGNNYDDRSSFSNYGTCVHLFAPGSLITGAWRGPRNDETSTISGTSMASPHVAGVVALLLGENPNLSFANVREVLRETATLDVIDLKCTNAICRTSPNLMLYAGCAA